MNNKDKKIVDEQEKLLDHLIEYGGRQYINDEIKKYEELPELEPSKEFDDKMHRMFKDAYKDELKHERIRFGKKIAVIAVATVGVISAAAMNIKAVREPVLNFVFHTNGSTTKTKSNIAEDSNTHLNFSFGYIPKGYKCTKEQFLDSKHQIMYKYENSDKNYFYINVQLKEKYNNYINQSSQQDYEILSIDNHKYYYLPGKNQTLMLYKNNNIFTITSTLPKKELLKIAKYIKSAK